MLDQKQPSAASENQPTRRAVLTMAGLVALTSGQALAAEPPAGLADLIAPRLSSVVSIRTVITSATGQKSLAGAGFVVTPDGLIATNRHVIMGASKIFATLPNREPIRARAVYVAEYLDFALLKIDLATPLVPVSLGDSDTVRIGDTAIVIGNPLAVGESLSVGVISALNRDIGEGRFDHFFQTDAAINHGNSGGPMFNAAGDVIAIATALYSSPSNTGSIGIGFGLPINDIKFITDQYLRTGKVVIGATGAHAQQMTSELAGAFGMAHVAGSIVTEVKPGGTADGKLRPGDIVLKVGTQEATDTNALARLIAYSTPGRILPMTFLRAGVEQHVDITIGREEIDPLKAMAGAGAAPAEANNMMKPGDPGFKVAPLSAADRKRLGLSDTAPGILVTSVDPHGVAAKSLDVGDLIMAIGSNPVMQPSDIFRMLGSNTSRHRDYSAFLVSGGRGTRWVAISLQNMGP